MAEAIDEVARTKNELRAKFKSVRSSISADERAAIDSTICDVVCALPEYQQAEVVLPYLSFGAEVDTRELIERAWAAGKIVALPRCTGPRQMRWFRVSSLDELELSSLGVEEPRIDDAAEQHLDTGERMVAIVPGFSFDANGYRLGYGGGFYDTFLADFPGTSIGLCRSAQRTDDLRAMGAIGQYDLPVNLVATES